MSREIVKRSAAYACCMYWHRESSMQRGIETQKSQSDGFLVPLASGPDGEHLTAMKDDRGVSTTETAIKFHRPISQYFMCPMCSLPT